MKNGQVDDIEIIQGCVRRQAKSQEMLYKKFFGYAMSVAMIYMRDRNDATEVVDDSFMKVFSEIAKFDTSLPFKAWLRRIVINSAIDHIRKNSKHRYFDETEAMVVRDNAPSVVSELTANDIIGLLNKLPPIHKLVFSLYELEGYSHDDIATQLKIPESSSRVYLARAKKQLREFFPVYFESNTERYANR